MQLSDVGASLRRHWRVSLAILVLTVLVMGLYLASRTEEEPSLFRLSADLLIPAVDPATGDPPPGVPSVLLYGQVQMALQAQGAALADAGETAPSTTMETVPGAAPTTEVVFRAAINEDHDIVTLFVEAPTVARADAILQSYVRAFTDARREAGLAETETIRDAQAAATELLDQQLSDVLAQLNPSIPLPPMVPEGAAIPVPPGTSPADELLLYERNSILNEMVRRKVDYGNRATTAYVPDDYATVVVQRPAIPVSVPPPSPTGPLVLIGVAGLLAALAVPLVLDRFNPALKDADAAARALRARVLARLPAIPRPARRTLAPRGSPLDSAFRALGATSISTDRLPRAILVTTPRGSIQGIVAANYAAALANLGLTSVLVGTLPGEVWDLDNGRRGGVPSETAMGDTDRGAASSRGGSGLEPAPPGPTQSSPTFPELLGDAHQGRLTGGVRARLATTATPNLYVVPPGDEDAPLTLDGLPPLLDALTRDGVDIAVIAGPALLEDSNATIIAWATRSVLWAVELGRVDSHDAQLAADRLELAGVEPFGLAVVDRSG